MPSKGIEQLLAGSSGSCPSPWSGEAEGFLYSGANVFPTKGSASVSVCPATPAHERVPSGSGQRAPATSGFPSVCTCTRGLRDPPQASGALAVRFPPGRSGPKPLAAVASLNIRLVSSVKRAHPCPKAETPAVSRATRSNFHCFRFSGVTVPTVYRPAIKTWFRIVCLVFCDVKLQR